MCTEDVTSDMINCTVACIDGMTLPSGIERYDVYRCGAETNYDWMPTENIPECMGRLVQNNKVC